MDMPARAMLIKAADLIRQVAATLDGGGSICTQCHCVQRNSKSQARAQERLNAMRAKLLAMARDPEICPGSSGGA